MDEQELIAAAHECGLTDVTIAAAVGQRWCAGGVSVEGNWRIAGMSLRIGLKLPDEFPACRPKVYLLAGAAEQLPHVDASGVICPLENEGTVHDPGRPHQVVLETLAHARNVLEDGLLGRNRDDFLAEAEAYWVGEDSIVSVVAANDDAREVVAFLGDRSSLVAVADNESSLHSRLPGIGGRTRRAFYLPLDRKLTLPGDPRRYACWPSPVLKELTPEANALLQQMRVHRSQSLVLVFGVPRPSGGRSLLGVVLEAFSHDDRLLCSRPSSVRRIHLDRFDNDRLLERTSPPHRRLAVIGCGAIGGHVAHALAWSGASELVLVDRDGYHGGNTYRHVLGREGWLERSKVSSLTKQLTRVLPNLSVTPLELTADAAFAKHEELLRGCDAIVVAIGNPSAPLCMNDDLAERRFGVPLVYTWLEPYGVGGHALLVRYGSPGCLRCLFHNEPSFRNAADFSSPGQNFSKSELGCYGSFTPYGDLDARETATMAARLVQLVLDDGIAAPQLRSWRGNARRFREAGFKTSDRYESFHSGTDTQLVPRAGCNACQA